MTNKNNRKITLLVGLSAISVAVGSQANEYSLDYNVEGRSEYNDNVVLRSEEKIDIAGGSISLPATLTSRSERMESSLLGAVTSSKYNESGFDSTDENLQGNTTYQLERGEVAGHAGYKRDSTRTTEFLDTGVVGLKATRVEEASAGGSGDYMFTEKNGIILGADYSDLHYESPLYDDYDYVSGYTGWQHQWSERTRLLLQGIGNRYESKADIRVTSDGLGAQVGFDSHLSEALSLFLLAGWVNVDTNYSTNSSVALPEDDSSDVFQMNGSLNYKQERYDLIAVVRSGTNPSGDGTLQRTDRLNLNWRYHVSERSGLDVGLVYGKNSQLNDDTGRDRDFARASLRLDYRIAESWYVAGTYIYSYQDRSGGDGIVDAGEVEGSADSNQFYASLIFQPEKSIWSR